MAIDCYKKFVTPNFKTIKLPFLRGTQKQIAYANAIRDKYTNIFIRKMQNINPLKGSEDMDVLADKFQAYVSHPKMLDSYAWIENHCPRCGCYMTKVGEMSYCSNDYCSFQKNNAEYTKEKGD